MGGGHRVSSVICSGATDGRGVQIRPVTLYIRLPSAPPQQAQAAALDASYRDQMRLAQQQLAEQVWKGGGGGGRKRRSKRGPVPGGEGGADQDQELEALLSPSPNTQVKSMEEGWRLQLGANQSALADEANQRQSLAAQATLSAVQVIGGGGEGGMRAGDGGQ